MKRFGRETGSVGAWALGRMPAACVAAGIGPLLVAGCAGLGSPGTLPPAQEAPAGPHAMEWIAVSPDGRGFRLEPSGREFVPWGFNYDHDEAGRLIEDYWGDEWAKVERDFHAMRRLGANVVRVHLQVGKFMDAPDRPNPAAIERLGRLLRLAERDRLWLDVTGLGCYHKKDVPAWYDRLGESARWDVQGRFWQAVAGQCAGSPAVFCYDLMNEPVVPGGAGKRDDWLGPPFGGKCFVQFIALEASGRKRPEIAVQWVRRMTAAIRTQDRRHLVTVGLVDWSLDRPGLTSGFVPSAVAGELDFLSAHIYPEARKVDEAIAALRGFTAAGKPVVIEETFPLRCGAAEFAEFIERSDGLAAGWIGFYWGRTPEELRKSDTMADAITLQWLEFFQKHTPKPAAIVRPPQGDRTAAPSHP